MLNFDLYIASMGRSGSTALANFLSKPEDNSYVFIEPNIVNFQNDNFLNQIIDFNLGSDCSSFINKLNEIRASGSLIGFKEVKGELHNFLGSYFTAEKIIVTCRSIDDTYLSLVEKHRLQRLDFDEQWSYEYCIRESAELIKFVNSNNIDLIVKYEDFIRSTKIQEQLLKTTGFNGGGDVSRGFERYGRTHETLLYAGKIQQRNKKYTTITAQDRKRAHELANTCSYYQKFFNYE